MTDAALQLTVLGSYLLVLVGIGSYAFKRSGKDPVSYFLAGRGLGTLVLAFTLLATLMSAFTFLGVPADAYTHGLGIFLGVGVTDALISVLFLAFGYRLWRAGKRFDFVTPSEFFSHRFQSPFLGLLYSLCALGFTAPYISIQIIGGGRALEVVTGGAVAYLPAAVIMALIITLYVLVGGMRAVAWTDTLQGFIMLAGMGLAFALIALSVPREAAALEPWLRLPGPTGRWSAQGLIGYQLLIFMAVPLFPQIFQRFFAAKSAEVFKKMMVVWPPLVLAMFFPAALIGVWGRAAFPALEQADQVMPLMLTTFLPPVAAAVVLTAAIAALMSTADAQLLTSSSLVTRDLYARLVGRDAPPEREAQVGRVTVVLLAVASFAIAVNPPGVIVEIATWSFQGSAMFFPTLVAGLYWQRCTTAGAVAGTVVSVGLTLGWLAGLLPLSWTFGWIPVVPAVVVGGVVLVVVSLLTQPDVQRSAAYARLWGGR
jgi:SSS family solute:Na+ symporter